VRVRVGHGWKTLVTENLQAADEFQRRWSTTNTETTKQSEKAPPPAGQKPQQHSQSLQGLKEVTLREVFNSFISWAETHKRSWRSDLQLFELRISPVLGPLHLRDITPEMVQTFIDGLKPVRKEGGHLSPERESTSSTAKVTALHLGSLGIAGRATDFESVGLLACLRYALKCGKRSTSWFTRQQPYGSPGSSKDRSGSCDGSVGIGGTTCTDAKRVGASDFCT
jgi:hypothetical protein